MKPHEVDLALNTLKSKKKELELLDKRLENYLLYQFLVKAKSNKLASLDRLKKEIDYLSNDLELASAALFDWGQTAPAPSLGASSSNNPIQHLPSSAQVPDSHSEIFPRKRHHMDISDSSDISINELMDPKLKAFNDQQQGRLVAHFQNLADNYFSWRMNCILRHLMIDPKTIVEFSVDHGLFSRTLLRASKYSSFRSIGSLHFADHLYNNHSSIVSSVEFDKDDEYFATAGVTKKIKIFDYSLVASEQRSQMQNLNLPSNSSDATNPQYPLIEMSSNAKISCLSWNPFVKASLLSSDYDGVLMLWDTISGAEILQFTEHEKRVWSVDFSELNPLQFASGGDDTKVKLWSSNQRNSCATIESEANICSVKFHPSRNNMIAFGSADHHIHCFDLRKTTRPLFVLKGHQKAVSYVKFLNSNQIISASTDSSLRLWSIQKAEESADESELCLRSFVGHRNDKNFVGLSVNCEGDFIACGSESNQVFAYHSELSNPIASHRFGNSLNSITGIEEPEEDHSLFVSSVCWKRKSPNVLVCANSQGRVKVITVLIKVMELV